MCGQSRFGFGHPVEVAEGVLMKAAHPAMSPHQDRMGSEADKFCQLFPHRRHQPVLSTQCQFPAMLPSDEGSQQRELTMGNPPLPLPG